MTLAQRVVVSDEASGMAVLLAGLLADNLRDFPARARVARHTRGELVLTAADRGISVTLRFDPEAIEIIDGAVPGAPSMAGSWLAMSRVCSGRISPLRALIDRELTLGSGRHLSVVPAGGFVLSVPASFYDEDEGDAEPKRRRLVIGGAVVAAAIICIVAARRRLADTCDGAP